MISLEIIARGLWVDKLEVVESFFLLVDQEDHQLYDTTICFLDQPNNFTYPQRAMNEQSFRLSSSHSRKSLPLSPHTDDSVLSSKHN